MKWCAVICLLFALVACDDLPYAEPCNEQTCQLPDCRCSSTVIPGGLEARDTPQFVLVTFDDNINHVNIETYRDILYNRKNSDNCPSGFTFYINHEYNNYVFVNELYNQGFEIALHSITHQEPMSYWEEASVETMTREFGDQILQMSHFANIPYDSIDGMRIPFLQLGGNSSYQMMAENGLLYDHTWLTITNIEPAIWPYTLEHASTQDCVIEPCPTASIPGVWVLPMLTWRDLNDIPCPMVDNCPTAPDLTDEEGWFQFIVSNFERQYLGNRAPFGFYIHAWYLSVNPAVERALDRFLDLINNLNDAFLVNSRDVIEWVQNPVPVNEYRQQPCNTFVPTTCAAQSCGPIQAEHKEDYDYWLQGCAPCPRVYPWLNNPLGV